MMEKKQEREGKNNTKPHSSLRDLLLNVLVIVIVLAIGLLCINLYMSFRYKAEFLSTPCNLCLELNPLLNGCFESSLTVYSDPMGNEITELEYIEAIEKEREKNNNNFIEISKALDP